MLTKNALCWIGLAASVLTSVGAALGAFGPKGVATGSICGAVAAGLTGWLAKSPIDHA